MSSLSTDAVPRQAPTSKIAQERRAKRSSPSWSHMTDWSDDLEPVPDWRQDWLVNRAAKASADRRLRDRLRQCNPTGFAWPKDTRALNDAFSKDCEGRAGELLARWVRNFFSNGVAENSSAKAEFSAMLEKWISKKTTPLRPILAPKIELDSQPTAIIWEKSVFCFTGSLNWGTREMAEGIIRSRGGSCQERPAEGLDYLIFGENYGGKFQQALALRAKGLPVVFIEGERLPAYF